MDQFASLYLPQSLKINLPYSKGYCSSNFLIRSRDACYCVSAYHPMLGSGLANAFRYNEKEQVWLNMNARLRGELVAGRINRLFDFSLIRIVKESIYELDLEQAISLPIQGRYNPKQYISYVETRFDTTILVKPARRHVFDTTLLLKSPSIEAPNLKPGDSGKLVTIQEPGSILPLGWAVGNNTEGGHLLPYGHLSAFLDTIIFTKTK